MSINKVIISGNLTRDPELKVMQGTTRSVLSFGVAVNDRKYNQANQTWENRPNFVDCVVYGSRADGLSKHLFKGSKVVIEGKLRYNTWETATGKRRSKLEVVVEELDFFSARKQEGAPQGDQPAYSQQPQQAVQQGQYAPQPQGQGYAYQTQPAPQYATPQYASMPTAQTAQPVPPQMPTAQAARPQETVTAPQAAQQAAPVAAAPQEQNTPMSGGETSNADAVEPLSADIYTDDIPF